MLVSHLHMVKVNEEQAPK